MRNLTTTAASAATGKFVVLIDPATGEMHERLATSAITTAVLWVDVTTEPAETGNPPGPRFEKLPNGSVFFIDSAGRAEPLVTGCKTVQATETFTVATDGQTAFTLAHPAVGAVTGSRNGVVLDAAAFTATDTAVTYVPASNNGSLLCAGQRITITYTWEDCPAFFCCDGTQGDAFDAVDATPCDNGTDAFEPASASCPVTPADAFE